MIMLFRDDKRKVKRRRRGRMARARDSPFLWTTLALGLISLVSFSILGLLFFLGVAPWSSDDERCSLARDADGEFFVSDGSVCVGRCDGVCFPRVRGICFGAEQVTLCGPQPPRAWSVQKSGGVPPRVMRFKTAAHARAKVPVVQGTCSGWDAATGTLVTDTAARWIRGPQLVADMKLMPVGPLVGPNPHHEAEKLLPATLLLHRGLLPNTSSLFWFTDPSDTLGVSRWSHGFLAAFRDVLRPQFLELPEGSAQPVCFEDAVLLSGITNSRYIPSRSDGDWLRERVLRHCGMAARAAGARVADVVVMERASGTRSIANARAVQQTLREVLRAPVRSVVAGQGQFCDQVAVAASADVLVTPHGSHNAATLFARPSALVVELFPFLYHVPWLGNLLWAARMRHVEVRGEWPKGRERAVLLEEEREGKPGLQGSPPMGPRPWSLGLFSWVLGWEHCFGFRPCMNLAKRQAVFVPVEALRTTLLQLVHTCSLVVEGEEERCKAVRRPGNGGEE